MCDVPLRAAFAFRESPVQLVKEQRNGWNRIVKA